MLTIGFAGTAKNTGKTTAALELVAQCRQDGLPIALTSIGYDGELRDNITGLPKPRYSLLPGEWVATTERGLRSGTATMRVLDGTGVQTALGEVLLAEIVEPGLVVLSGPNRRADIQIILERLEGLGVAVTIVDGALNRLVPMMCADGLVLSTGAAFDERIPWLAEHARALTGLFRYPVFRHLACPATIHLVYGDRPPLKLTHSSLLGEASLVELFTAIEPRPTAIVIPHACDPGLVERLLERYPQARESRWVFGDPLKLIASGSPLTWERVLEGLVAAYLDTIPLHCLTVNPFYPCYQPQTGRYEAGWVDKTGLLRAVGEEVVQTPVFDLRQAPTPDLLDLIGLSTKEAK